MIRLLFARITLSLFVYGCILVPRVKAQEWEALGQFHSLVLELFPDTVSDQLFIGGQFRFIDGIYTGTIVSYDGNTFHHTMADSNSYMNYCWNGGCSGVSSICAYNGEIVASRVRSSAYEATPQIIGIGSWDGQGWHPLEGGVSDLYNDFVHQWEPATAYDFCIADDLLYVAGYITYVDSLPAHGLASWDGDQWDIIEVPDPPPGNAILATSVAKYKGELYLGGNFMVNVDGQQTNDLIRFDGTEWHRVGDGLNNGWTNMHDLEVFAGKLYVAGYFTQADGNPGNSIMSWDGEQWNDLGGGVCTPFGAIDDLFVYKNKLYVAGYFDCIGGIEAHNVATWDGEKWCNIGNSIFNRAIHAVAVWQDTVYVGGSFFEVDGQPVKYLAKYIGDHSTDTCSAPISAVPELAGRACKITPNPASAWLDIQAPVDLESVLILDVTGKEVLRQAGSGARVSVLVEGLRPGLYVVLLRAAGEVWSGRFVKG